MKHISNLLAAAALAAVGMAQAESVSFTLKAGPSEQEGPYGGLFTDLGGGASLSFSDDLMGALDVAAIQTTAVAPGTVDSSGPNTSLNTEVQSARITLHIEPGMTGFTVPVVRTAGGATMVTSTKNFATTGGSLSITNLTVDLQQRAIYANLTGANGLGTVNNVHLWTYAGLTLQARNDDPCWGMCYVHLSHTLTGLTITDNGFGLLAQSLGLRTGGINAMRAVTDFGTLTTDLAIQTYVTHLPEPSTYALMGLGIVGIGIVARRRRHASVSIPAASPHA